MNSIRERIAEFIELKSVAERPCIQIIERKSDDGYSRTLVRYTVSDADVVEAFVFEPVRQNAKAGVLVLHQHNSQWVIGKSEVAGLAIPCRRLGLRSLSTVYSSWLQMRLASNRGSRLLVGEHPLLPS